MHNVLPEMSSVDARPHSRSGLFGLPLGTLFMEAHSGLSALIADRSGFEGIWASGFAISSAKGRRDCGEVSLTELAQVVAEIADVTDLPVLTDADTGFGDYNNCRLTARHLRRAGARGMVIEDKVSPKANSFLDIDHAMLEIDEFAGRVRAVKDAMGEDFTLIARTEAFIAGHSLEVALARAQAYDEAGADGVFIHTKRPMSQELQPFLQAFQSPTPLVIAPTMYPDVTFDVFKEMGIAVVLCANHNMRASALAMLETCRQLRQSACLADISDRILPISDVFELLDYDELERSRSRFYPRTDRR